MTYTAQWSETGGTDATATPDATASPVPTLPPGATSEPFFSPVPGSGAGSESNGQNAPQTGDESHIGSWAALMCLSLIGLTVTLFFLWKREGRLNGKRPKNDH